MAKYIDVRNYCENICRCAKDKCDKEKCPILTAPAADVAEVRHGKWGDTGIEELDLIYAGYKCSVCGYIICGNMFNYCPNCGTKMDGSDSDE